MRHNNLRSIAHNIADSFADGNGFLIGFAYVDVYGEATASPEQSVLVDFLQGTVTGSVSDTFRRSVYDHSHALPGLCQRQGAEVSDFHHLTVRYANDLGKPYAVVDIEDRNGRRSRDVYVGRPLAHVRKLDDQGRIRRVRDPG